MKSATKRTSWFEWDRILAIGVVSLGIFGASFISDVYLEMKGVPLTATIVNNVAIGLFAAQRFSRMRSRCRAIRNSSAPKNESRS